MFKGLTRIVAAMLIATFAATSAFAQKVGEDEKNLCIEAIKDLTDGKPPAEAVKLCGEGKIESAMEKAMAAQGDSADSCFKHLFPKRGNPMKGMSLNKYVRSRKSFPDVCLSGHPEKGEAYVDVET